ncbi:MAG: leucine-rich repeat protein [Dysgonomonas sp.]
MTRKFLLLFISLALCLLGKADPINVSVSTPGGLKEVLEAGYTLANIEDLTVTGTIDARDFATLRTLAKLKKLDISGVTIAAFTGTGGTSPLTTSVSYAANAIPLNGLYTMQGLSAVGLDSLKSVKLPTTIVSIGSNAFSLAKSLESVDFGVSSQLDTIGTNAFMSCASLTTLSLPAGVRSLSTGTFTNCTGLTSITIPDGVTVLPGSLFYGCTNLSSVSFSATSNLTTISNGAFSSLDKLKKVTIPKTVTSVGATAFSKFYGDSILVEAGNTVYASIGGVLAKAALDTIVVAPVHIKSFTIPATVTALGREAFRYCDSLKTISIPSSVTSLGQYALANCPSLTNITLEGTPSISSISDYAFYQSPITSFTIPAGVTSIGNYAFSGTAITSITIPATVTSLGTYLFASCSNLVTANLSALSLTVLPSRTFNICPSLTSVSLPAGLTTISDYSLYSCKALKTVTLPATVTAIGNYAFAYSGFETINLPEGLLTIGNYTFDDLRLGSVSIPASVTSIGTRAFNRVTGLISVSTNNQNYSSFDGALYNKAQTTLLEAPTALVGRYTIPKTVTSIDQYAFYNDSLLTSVEFPAGLAGIGNNAFWNCNLLKKLVVKNPTPIVFTSGNSPFYGLPTTLSVLVPAASVDAYKAALKWKDFASIKGEDLFYDLGWGYPNRVSPNGQYVTGSGAFLWKLGDEAVTYPAGGAGGESVTNDGFIVGTFADSTYMVNGSPLENGGIYKNGKWISLGLGRFGTTTTSSEAGSRPSAVSADGKMVAGMSYQLASFSNVVPFVWKEDASGKFSTDTLTYVYPYGGQGARIWDVSDDGSIACGWTVYPETSGGRRAIVWKSPTEYKILDSTYYSEARDVSPNGKYVATSAGGKAGLYDVQKDTLILFGPSGASPTGVSNDGLVVGYRPSTTGRKGFVWSEKLGYVELKDFIDTYAADVELPEFFQFTNDEDEEFFDVPMHISGDGKVIVGWRGQSAVYRKAWVLSLAKQLDLMNRPLGLTAAVPAETRNTVNLAWSAPEVPSGHTLDFYKVYRDGVAIATIDADQPTYTDSNVPSGYPIYAIAAIYDLTSTSSVESPKSDNVTVTVVDSYQLPFAEGFDTGTFDTNYWASSLGSNNGWLCYTGAGYNNPLGYAATFITTGNQEKYLRALTSKPLDARGQNKVTASFLYQIEPLSTLVGVKDTVYFEVSNDAEGTSWTTVKPYVLNAAIAWTPQTIDLTDLVKNKIFRTRFRAASGANRTYIVYYLDEFSISIASVETPKEVTAVKNADNSLVNVTWQDPSGSYGLTYARSEQVYTIGNEGVPFIAANKFTSTELAKYKDKYLTSISTYVYGKSANANVDTKLKLAVFVGGTRVVTQNVASFTENAWNTFKLDTPVAIPASGDLTFGIEVANHDVISYPMMTDSGTGVEGFGDLFTEDNGVTWQTLTSWNYPYNWSIIGNVRASATTSSERTNDIIGYELYRDGVKINSSLQYGQAFVDSTLTATQTACYSVKAFYRVGGISDLSAAGCVVLSGIDNSDLSNVSVYPNPATEYIYINGEFTDAALFDMNGRKVIETAISPITVSSLPAGVYTIKIVTKDGIKIGKKVIVKK